MTFGSVFGRTFSPTFQPSSQAAGGGTVIVGTAADTFCSYGSYASTVYGANTNININDGTNYTALLRFNLSSIPASATCTEAKLTVTNTGTWYSYTFRIYEIASANGDWTEAGACGKYKYGTTAWAGSARLLTAGTDYINTVIASKTIGQISANTAIEIPFNASGLAVVKSWFGQSTNSGICMWRDAGGTKSFYSKEETTESYRPTLTVTYE